MRVIVADDEVLLRRGLESVLAEGHMTVVAFAGDAAELFDAVERVPTELVIADIRMPPTHSDEGLAAVLALRRIRPELPVCLLSQHVLRQPARALTELGGAGVGYLLKQRVADIDSFLTELHRIVAGEVVLDPEVAEQLVNRADPIGQLTVRQREVLALVAQGRSNASIAEALHLTQKSVGQHVSRIYASLGLHEDPAAHRRVQAVVSFLSA